MSDTEKPEENEKSHKKKIPAFLSRDFRGSNFQESWINTNEAITPQHNCNLYIFILNNFIESMPSSEDTV